MSNIKLPNIRKLFIPDKGYVIFDADLAGADAQVVAWEADDRDLKAAFHAGLDIHAKNATDMFGERFTSLKPESGPWKKIRKASKTAVHLCLTADHEVLTPKGWTSITTMPEEIACWNLKNEISFQRVVSWYEGESKTDFFEWDEFAYSQKITSGHRLPYQTDKNGFKVTKVEALPHSARLPKGGFWTKEQSSIGTFAIRLLCAIQADGSRSHNKWRFHLKKKRKIVRLHTLLEKLKIPFDFAEYADGTTNTSFIYTDLPKQLDYYVFDWSRSEMEAYVDEAKFWDGSIEEELLHKRECLTSKHKEHIEWFQTLCHLIGKASQRYDTPNGYFGTSVNNRPLFRYTAPKQTYESLRIYCPTTPTGFFLVRRNNVISITGNTNYGGKPMTMTRNPLIAWPLNESEAFQRKWFGLHPGILEWHKRKQHELQTSRTAHNAFGYRIIYFDRLDGLLPQALAWTPQSTVAEVTFRGALQLKRECPWVEMLLQVHDSLVFQVPFHRSEEYAKIRAGLRISVPYADPLIIPWGLKSSPTSWGDVEKVPG